MLKITAAASTHTPLADQPIDLRQPLKAMTGQHFRRINRFIELALLGALRCREAAGTIADDTALYLACDTSMLAESARLLEDIEIRRLAPSPFAFMNISGNMAGWTVGQQLGLNGPQLMLHRNRAGFEAALELLSLPLPQHRRALLGYVEEGVWPLDEQRQRFGLLPGAEIAECSHWLHVDRDCERPLAVIERCERYRADDQAIAALSGLPAATLLATDATVDFARWSRALGLNDRFEAAAVGFSTGETARKLCRYVIGETRQPMLHLNRAEGGELQAILIARA